MNSIEIFHRVQIHICQFVAMTEMTNSIMYGVGFDDVLFRQDNRHANNRNRMKRYVSLLMTHERIDYRQSMSSTATRVSRRLGILKYSQIGFSI